MLEPIIQYLIDKGDLNERAVYDIRRFAAEIESDTAYAKSKLALVIQKINHQTVQRNSGGCLPWIELGHDMDNLGLLLYMEFGLDNQTEREIGEVIVRGRYELGQPTNAQIDADFRKRDEIKIDTHQFPISQLNYSSYHCNEMALFYTWLAYWWQELDGLDCGLKVMTRQNNSDARFSLNDFLQDGYSAYVGTYDDLFRFKIANIFPRKLTVIELYLRASQPTYPFNPYSNYWRYFEKQNSFKEIVTYEFATGIRQGALSEHQTANVVDVIQHADPKTAMSYLTDFVNQMTRDGWEEKFRPFGLPERMHENAYEFGYWSGIAKNWFEKGEKTFRLSLKDVLEFELAHKLKLPDSFAHYLRVFNGRQYNRHLRHFPIDDLYTVEIEQFYTIDELYKSAATKKNERDILWIGTLVNEGLLGICINPQDTDNYGKIAVNKNDNVKICEYSFEKFAKYAQGHPVTPESFAVHTNDVAFLKKRLAEGWDVNETQNSSYLPLLYEAARHNAHDALELLLENGAKRSPRKNTTYPSIYDAKTIEILARYE